MIPRFGPLGQLLERDGGDISEAGRTMLLFHGRTVERVVVLFHGLTSTPKQFQRYAHALFERGHNVLVPRLPRHGHCDRLTEVLADLTEAQLRAFASESLEAARTLGERVTVAGFSAGGTLALWLAQHAQFDRAVAVAPFFGAAIVPPPLMGPLCASLLRLPNRFMWWDPVQRERQMPEHGYPRYPTHALARLYLFSREVVDGAANAPPKACHVVLVFNSGEASVSNAATRTLASRWRRAGARIEELVLPSMPPSHDVIEPERRGDLATRVFPLILDAIDPERELPRRDA